jgi:hypothetical protein
VVIQERELVRDEPANKVGADVDLIGMHPHPLILTVAALGGARIEPGAAALKLVLRCRVRGDGGRADQDVMCLPLEAS